MSLRIVLALALGASLLTLSAAPALAGVTGTTSTQSSAPGPDARRVLAHRMHGTAAVEALGAQIAPVASQNHLSTTRLERILTTDHTAWLAADGQLYYQEGAAATATAAGSTEAPVVTPAYPTAQTFALHSRPSAGRTIFLDFDGAEVSGTAWNDAPGNPLSNGPVSGYDTDGSPSTFSTSEQGFIQEVWRQVAETYSPFDVDVTTADPGDGGIVRSTSTDTTYGTHVLVTSSAAPRQQICAGTCLGLAYVGTFGLVGSTPYYQPAFVFAYDRSFDPQIIAQAAAHETGHNLGLHHDGTASSEYYSGTAAWGPLMGSSRYRAVSQFSQGEYAGANDQEDDLAIIGSFLPLRADDSGDTTAGATQLGAATSYAVSGVISTRTDSDVFAIDAACAGTLTASSTGIGAQSSLDLRLDVLNASGTVVASDSPVSGHTSSSPPVSTGMDASVTVPHTAGTYYLRVDGVGSGDAAGTWSDYGSLGEYQLTVSTCSTTASPTTPTPSTTATPTTQTKTQPAGTPTSSSPPKPSTTVQVTRPSAPRIGVATGGARGGASTALARWSAPASTGGAAVTKYRVRAVRLTKQGRATHTYASSYLTPALRALTMRLPQARYVFSVQAVNRAGTSAWSSWSRVVLAR